MKGYIKDTIEEDHYVLGGGFLPQKVVVNPTGDWSDYLPVFEAQASKFETWGCTVFGTLNCIEILIKYILKEEKNFSERFIYNLVPVTEPGANPHTIAEKIRENGLISENSLPMTDSYEDFCKPLYMPSSLLIEGQQFLNDWDFKHEHVFKDNEKDKDLKLKDMLRYSPLGVSVHAWKQNGNVFFKDKNDDDNHWTVLYKIDDKGYKHVFDSYEGTKVLTPDYDFGRAKVYFLFKRTTPRIKDNWLLDLIKRIYGFFK